MKIILLFICFLIPIVEQPDPIIKRHDTSESDYLVKENIPDFLIDLPHEGHGVLISEQWILTVAHTIFYDYRNKKLTINGSEYVIQEVIIHPNYEKDIPEAYLSGDSKPFMKFLHSRSDIALIKISEPVKNSNPIELYTNRNEMDQIIEIYGKGATGNGLTGEQQDTRTNQTLRFCRNVVTGSNENWLTYVFDPPQNAIELEGMHGSGDSGGPSIIYVNKKPYLAGLSSWQYWDGDLTDFKAGLYGTTAYQTRVSSYIDWINKHINNR